MSIDLDVECNVKPSERNFNLPEKLLVGAGPSNCSPRVLRAMGLQTLTPLNEELYTIMDDIQSLLKYILQTRNNLTFVQQTSGLGGIETIISNLIDPKDKILIAVGGAWGDKMEEIANKYHCVVVRETVQQGEIFQSKKLEELIIREKPEVLFIVQGESSAGINQPLDGLGKICHKYNCLLVVDAVASVGAHPLFMDRWEIDAVVGGAQKALSAPAGVCFLSFSLRAVKRISSKRSPIPYYFDVLKLAKTWNCFEPSRMYYYTYNSNLLCGVREALATTAEEGLQNSWHRHKICAERLWSGVEKLGLEIFVPKKANRLHTVIPVVLPSMMDRSLVVDYLSKKYHTQLSVGMGPSESKHIIRIGIMGFNAREEVVDYVLNILDEAIHVLNKNSTS